MSLYRDNLKRLSDDLADQNDRRDAARVALAKVTEALAAAQRESDQADAAAQQAHDQFRAAIDAALVYVPAPMPENGGSADTGIKAG